MATMNNNQSEGSLGQWRHQIKYKMPMVAKDNSADGGEI
eukprot:CAMPEP_0194446720 /NCGR_PEP_ID=MMETSP0176-20130528/128602_1 /TAXON_ID=216777 /ORGANISM="Proboscia alata, Strain PI-D3" /LENGTH=38 /DNA_ID= /DNA_START= /DNA_END= /DNA_ORIENTATION=